MKWKDYSEVCFGLVIEGRHPVTLYKPEQFTVPYDSAIEVLLQKGATKEDVAKVISSAYMVDATEAVHKFNGLGEYQNFDWAKGLAEAARNYERGKKFEKLAKKFLDNDPVDILPVHAELTAAIAQESNGLQPLSEVSSEYKPFKKSGYEPLDRTLGGIPTDGPIIFLATTGTGKSKWATVMINSLLHQYPDEKAAVYTLEMPSEHWKWRAMNMFPSLKEVQDRLFVSGAVRDIDELVAEITAKEVDYVVLDDMDNIVKSQDASEYERVYRRVKEICRFMKIPVFVLAQPNRQAKWAIQNGERFPSLYDSAWSGASENSAALFLAAYTGNGLDMKSEDPQFPVEDTDLDYIIAWKSRDGWPADYDPKGFRGPGAIVMEHSPDWLGKPYTGKWKLWTPGSSSRSIGKSSKQKDIKKAVNKRKSE